MNARFQRGVLGAGALAAVVLLVTETTPRVRSARRDLASAETTLARSEEKAGPLLAAPRSAPDLEGLREELRRASLFFEIPLDPAATQEGYLAEARASTMALLSSRHEIPERLLRHLFPPEAFESGGRAPSPAEREAAARRLRIAESAVDTLLRHRIPDIDFLVFPPESPEGGTLVVLRYRAAATDHALAYAAFVGRRTEPPFFLPRQLSLAANPAGEREGDLVVRLELWVPSGEESRGS